ncbi:cytochrome C [Dyella jiangningensis]|uniref:Cytochrome C n=2 Tax=Dyella jiangningensis TaxID=1379159 RepID=A0A328P849_9GAMM|nr:cytochrome C [Dyella jiangningensis]
MVPPPRIDAVSHTGKRHAWAWPWLAAGLMAALPSHAGVPAKPARLGLCAACHGETGMAQIPGAPNLAGQKLDYLREALKQYRDGRRNVPLMRAAIGPMSDADLDELARWYSAQTPHPQGHP